MKKALIILTVLIVFISANSQTAKGFDPDYLKEVVGRKAVSLGDGCELMMYLLRLEGQFQTFEAQMDFLKRNQFVKTSIAEQPADTPLKRGELAYMLGKMLRLKGGVKARLFGWNERFAMEELMHHGIMREGHGADFITGEELVLIMTQAAGHMASRMHR